MPADLTDRHPWLLELRLAGRGEHPPDLQDGCGTNVHVWRTPDGTGVAYGFRRDDRYWMQWPSFATYGFAAGDPRVTAYPEPGPSLASIRDVFSRSVLPMALQALGFEALHASSIVSDVGLIVFAGRSKMGKSTLAFGLSRRGFQQWSDDGVVFRTAGGTPEAVPLPFSVRLRRTAPTSASRTDAFRWPDRVPTRIAAVCFVSQLEPNASGPAIRLRPIGRSDAFRSLLTNAHEFDPANGERRGRLIGAYLDLAAAAPAFELEYLPDPTRFEDLLDRIAAQLALHPADALELSSA